MSIVESPVSIWLPLICYLVFYTCREPIVLLDAATLIQQGTLTAGPSPGDLALLPDGRTLIVLDLQQDTVWSIPLPLCSASTWSLGRNTGGRRNWLALDPTGGMVYVARSIASTGAPPEMWRVDVRRGQVSGPFPIPATPPCKMLS